MGKCRICKNEINLTVAGLPVDLCWGCIDKISIEKILDKAVQDTLLKCPPRCELPKLIEGVATSEVKK